MNQALLPAIDCGVCPMPAVNNPFKPTLPVYKGMFAGRTTEIKRIETVLSETKNQNPTNLLIVGERGIGKTSLIFFAKHLAEGKSNFMSILLSLDRRTTVGVLARKISTSIERQLRQSEQAILRFLARTKDGEFTEVDPNLLDYQRRSELMEPAYEDEAYFSWYG
jgi:Cdc6-like AAA superfamily ATPase